MKNNKNQDKQKNGFQSSSLHHFKMIYTEFRLFFELIQSDYQFDFENKKSTFFI